MRTRGAEIRRRRELAGHGLRNFAAQVDISASHLSRLERDLRGAQPEVVRRIADKLNAAVSDIADLST
ncbi:helix-turn-helix transcriptional regulator [Streptomyces sp. LS1784]|uniref:helix-turn-helix domain-containing protein n=1 Tax=Streptomyces sp. LS1784 TaxID=2851533 RepID=UPI001CCF700B